MYVNVISTTMTASADVLRNIGCILLRDTSPLPYSYWRATCRALHAQYAHYLEANEGNLVIIECAYNYAHIMHVMARCHTRSLPNYYFLVTKAEVRTSLLNPRNLVPIMLRYVVHKAAYDRATHEPVVPSYTGSCSAAPQHMTVFMRSPRVFITIGTESTQGAATATLVIRNERWAFDRINYTVEPYAELKRITSHVPIMHHDEINRVIPDIILLEDLCE